MKSLIITLCLLTFQFAAQAQNQLAPRLSQKESGTWLEFEVAIQTAATELAQNKTALQLGTNDNLSPISIQEDEIGHRHHRYQQTYKGITVEGAIFILHEKNNRVAKANGNLIPDLNMSVTPTISEATALQSALQYTNATVYAWQNTAYENLIKKIKNDPNATLYPEGELLVIDKGYKQKTADYKLAYKFDIYALEPQTRQYLFVDAQTGEVLKTENRIHNCTDPASGVTNYSGTVDFTACHDSNTGQHILKSAIGGGGMQVFDALNTNDSPLIPFTDNDNFFDSTPTANEVHWAVEKTSEYYSTRHNRESMDGNGMSICSWIRYERTPNNKNNAYWNGMFLQFGDGDGVNYTSFTSPDIVAHEYTHGVTDFTANLKYYNEHGALNESFSDIFGEVAERYMRGTNDWIIGADFVINPNFNGIRNMSNPKDETMTTEQPDTYLGVNWKTGFNDNGGVHTNSGVQNYWFYLLAEGGSGVNDNGDAYTVDGIGIDKAAAIAYRNLAVYLTPTSEYADARTGAILAAEDLYGVGSDEALQTEAAWYAVGIGIAPIDCRTRDSLALVALYEATDGANWNSNAIWDLTQPMNTWSGVSFDENGCVIQVYRYSSGLNGSIPPEIGDLTNLTLLYLYNNELSNIPPEIGNLTNLDYLNLQANGLTGNIPPEIGNLTNLTLLGLSNNEFTSSIPPEIGNLINLAHLGLYSSGLTGSIPPEIGNLTKLTSLSLSKNEFTGSIPPEIGNLTNLTNLGLSDNGLTGSIPSEMGNLTRLTHLELSNNELSGCYDVNLLNLAAGSNYSISNGNNFDASWEAFRYNLNGTGACSTPIYGDCHQNDSLALIALYNSIGITNWDLNQPVHTWYGVELNGFGCVVSLILWEYDMNIILPDMGTASSLQKNELIGSIPPEIGNLTNLIYLNLQDNQLIGNIPPEIGNLTNLIYLNLQDNQLSDSIPPEIGNLTNLTSLYLGSNDLSGSILPEIGNLINLTSLDLSYNDLSGCYDENLMSLCSQLSSFTNTNNSISNGNNFDVPWEDFCNTGIGTCGYFNAIVYPGDFNNDGTANAADLLYWGLAEGSTGFPRPSATNNWTPQNAYQWEAVHEDGNGDGIVDFNDIATLEQNYDSTYLTIEPDTLNQGLVTYELKLDSIVFEPKRTLYFDLYAKSKTGGALNTHGLVGTVDCSLLPIPYNAPSPAMDTIGSGLHPSAHIARYDNAEKQLHFALTRTDKNNQFLNIVPVAIIIVEVDDLKAGQEVEYRISANSGSLMHANGATVPVGATALSVLIGNSTGGTGEFTSSVTSADEQCNLLGWIEVEVEGGKEPYTYQWSNGNTTQNINNLTAGIYALTVTDNLGANFTRSVEIAPPVSIYDGDGHQLDCTGERIYATLDLCVLLEGAYDNATQQMSTLLNDRGLLSGQTPINPLATPTPSGQPYNQPPWNYSGTEGQGWSGINYSSDVVDWILVSFRTGISAATEIAKTTGLLMKDGCIDFPDRNVLPKDIGGPVYIVIEHRNHMGIMTTNPVNIINNTLTYDFRLSDSYDGDGTGSGQKQLPDGNWAMFAGDCDQTDFPSYDITGEDKTIWVMDNGNFDVYTPADFNLDADVNGDDKILWQKNNGMSSRVPK